MKNISFHHKRRYSVLSFILILLLGALLYTSIDLFQFRGAVDFAIGGDTTPAGYIVPGITFMQELPVDFTGIVDEVQLLVATYCRPDYHLNDATILVKMTNLRNGVSTSEIVPIAGFIDNSYYSISFSNGLNVRKNDVISLEVEEVDTVSENAPTIWLYSEMTINNNRLPPVLANGEALPGAFAMTMSYSRFDYFLFSLAIVLLFACIIALMMRRRNVQNIRFKKFRVFAKGILVLAVIPAITFLLLQYMVLQERHHNKWNVIFPLVAYMSVYLIAYLLSGRFSWSYFITNALFLAAYIANACKVGVRGDVFLPSDLFAFSEAMDYARLDMIRFFLNSGLIVFLLFFVFIMVMSVRFFAIRLRGRRVLRLGSVGLIVVLFLSMLQGIIFKPDKMQLEYGISNERFDQLGSVRLNGLIQVLLMNSDSLFVHKPKDYSQKAVNDIFQQYSDTSQTDSNDGVFTSRPMPDNVIVIMNESFYDLSQIQPELEKYDVMSNVDRLSQECISGQVIVPVLGGLTCNSEFEFLTGFSMVFLPTGALPYQQYIHRSTPSIVSVMSDLGYETIATHPNGGEFWNRNIIYDHFGFDEFYAIEAYNSVFSDEVKIRGKYSDHSMYEFILDEIDQEKQPTFLFAITMQNHSPHLVPGKESEDDVTGDDELDVSTKIVLNLIQESDKGIQFLLDELEKRDETTVVIFFGDHAPPMGAGFFGQLPETNYLDKYATPYFIYATSNYDLDYSGPTYDRMSLNYLGYYFLDVLGVNSGVYQTVLREAYSEDPVLSLYREDLVKDTTILRNYEILQYYYIFGKS